MIGGDDRFCELAVIGENMRALGGWWLYISMALKDSDLYARYALNQYLNGMSDRNQFKAIATLDIENEDAPAEMIDGFVRAFDEVSSDPRKFLDAYDVEYLELRVGQPLPAYIKDGWVLVEGGPYWQIWQRAAPPPPGGKTSVNAGFNTLGSGHPSSTSDSSKIPVSGANKPPTQAAHPNTLRTVPSKIKAGFQHNPSRGEISVAYVSPMFGLATRKRVVRAIMHSGGISKL
jgi:hypothetical protein